MYFGGEEGCIATQTNRILTKLLSCLRTEAMLGTKYSCVWLGNFRFRPPETSSGRCNVCQLSIHFVPFFFNPWKLKPIPACQNCFLNRQPLQVVYCRRFISFTEIYTRKSFESSLVFYFFLFRRRCIRLGSLCSGLIRSYRKTLCQICKTCYLQSQNTTPQQHAEVKSDRVSRYNPATIGWGHDKHVLATVPLSHQCLYCQLLYHRFNDDDGMLTKSKVRSSLQSKKTRITAPNDWLRKLNIHLHLTSWSICDGKHNTDDNCTTPCATQQDPYIGYKFRQGWTLTSLNQATNWSGSTSRLCPLWKFRSSYCI